MHTGRSANMNTHVCTAARWLAVGLLFFPALAYGADLAVPDVIPGVGSIGSISWPAAFCFGIYSLKGSKLPPVVVNVNVKQERPSTED